MLTMFKNITSILAIGIIFLSAGCAKLERTPIPGELISKAEIQGIKDIRSFGGGFSEQMQQDLELSIKQESETIFLSQPSGHKVYKGLALSSGGANGAFGAGFLAGWTAHGSRPDFKIVTGISTGAIIAPFAFLGSEYDPQLEDLFTSTSTDTLVKFKGIGALFTPESLFESTPMLKRMQKIVDENFLAQVAKEHNKGKRLLIGTTHLDAGRLVVWNMGKIANSGHPNALSLFHQIILASASIPGIFPPVLIDVEADGNQYDEMHVDGGVKAQFFLMEALVNINKFRKQTLQKVATAQKEIYVIRNGKIATEPKPVKRNIVDILKRTSDDMTETAVRDSLYRLYTFAEKTGADFNYIGVPEKYEFIETDEYANEAEMIRLFNEGYQQAIEGPRWEKKPPGFDL